MDNVINTSALGYVKECKLYQELTKVMDSNRATNLVFGLIKERSDDKLSYLNLREGLLCAFNWNETSQGTMFWGDISCWYTRTLGTVRWKVVSS